MAIDAAGGPQAHLRHLLDHLAHELPAQGPIGVFVHHNTLHAFEHLPFHEAVTTAGRLHGAEPYMTVATYRDAHRRGRITDRDLDLVLADEPAPIVIGALTTRDVRRAVLTTAIASSEPETIRWRLEEGDLAGTFADGTDAAATLAFWLANLSTVDPPLRPPQSPVSDELQAWVIRLAACFLDQGMAYWPMPERQRGFYAAARRLMAQGGLLLPTTLRGADKAFAAQARADRAAMDVVLDWLAQWSSPDRWHEDLRAQLLALPGWAGLFAVLERQPALAPHIGVPATLADYLAVRLTFDAAARANESAIAPAAATPADVSLARAVTLAGVSATLGLSWEELSSLSVDARHCLERAILAVDDGEQRRLWHAAYERHHEREVLLALASHRRHAPPRVRPDRSAQFVFCIDEREESMRRAVEEVDRRAETFGAAGFFGIAVNYQGLDDAHGVALCPVVVTPQHAVAERPHADDEAVHARRTSRRRLLGRITQAAGIASRTLVRGWVSTVAVGAIAAVPLIGRVLAPRTFGRLRSRLNDALLPWPRTELTLMREDHDSQERIAGLLAGFSLPEKADRVASVLAPMGLTGRFARLVVVLGHGSTSLNNPHESAHDCGACGGRRGGPNARLFAAMANHPGVRRLLRDQGVDIPDTTWFVGGYHDTSSDDVELFDLESVPASHAADLAHARAVLDTARALNAQERSRRFASCPAGASPARALLHVEARAEHLAQPRPEYGHGTNAVCIVGRRATTEGLFLDRRSFLVSYDAHADADDQRLARLLGAAMPVCAGISLEYYFSFVDNERYGCGTKLPHNVTGLVGVMNGHASDLRTGLPWQMVETHEPVRILFVVETTPARLWQVLMANPGLERLVRGAWIRLATLDPDSGDVQVWRGSAWEPLRHVPSMPLPQFASSSDYFDGERDFLPPAWIRDTSGAATGELTWAH